MLNSESMVRTQPAYVMDSRHADRRGFAHSWIRLGQDRVEIDLRDRDTGHITTSQHGWIELADEVAAAVLGAETPERLIGRHLVEFFVDPWESSSLLAMAEGEVSVSDVIVDLRRLDGTRLSASVTTSGSAGRRSWQLTPLRRNGIW